MVVRRVPLGSWCSTWMVMGRRTIPRTSKKLRQPSYCSSPGISPITTGLMGVMGSLPGVLTRARRVVAAPPMPIWGGGDANALPNTWAASTRLMVDDSCAFGFGRQVVAAGHLSQDRVPFLDDAEARLVSLGLIGSCFAQPLMGVGRRGPIRPCRS